MDGKPSHGYGPDADAGKDVLMARPTDWIDTRVAFQVAQAAQGLQSLMTGVAPVNMRGMTLIRTIISLGVFSTTTAGAWGVQAVDFGIGVASQEAFAAGVVPDPDVPTDKPPRGWVWRTAKNVAQNGSSTEVVTHLMADIRGARKIENGELYIAVDNNNVQGTSFEIDVQGLIRTLYKL